MIYLASQSPRRRQLLEQIGVHHELLLPEAGEDAEALEAVLPGEPPDRYVQRVTGLKLQAAVQRLQARGLPPAPVLCADTTVALDGDILGKPADDDEAARMLARLSGRTHEVLTAIRLWPLAGQPLAGQPLAGQPLAALSRSQVRLACLSARRIAAYVASGEPRGKAGAYGVQGRAAAFIEHISGSYSGIMGLPLFETAQLLEAAGVIPT